MRYTSTISVRVIQTANGKVPFEHFHHRPAAKLGLDMITVGDQQNLVTARQQAAQEAANRIHQETERFVADCVSSLRELTAALCDEMLESIRTSETGVQQ